LIARLCGGLVEARERYLESLRLNQEVEEKQGIAASLVGLAQVAHAEGRSELAVQLLGQADAVVVETGPQLLPFDREQHDLILAELRTVVAEPSWSMAWSAGRHASIEALVEAPE